MNSDRRKLNKIYSQIDKIAIVGKDNFIEYCKFIDNLIDNSDYSNLLQTLDLYYNINISNLLSVDDVKNKTWKQIRLLTNLSLLKRIKKLYDSKYIYQTSFNIYTNNTNVLLGTINEVTNFSDEAKYYIKNKEFARITKTRKVSLEVLKSNQQIPIILNDYDNNLSEDDNIYNKYVTAVNLLIL